ncbi:hypothetical protein V8C26DRAFT_153836 [Trichoderma gracile]
MERFTIIAPHLVEKDAWTADLDDLPFAGMRFLVKMLTVPVMHKSCPKPEACIKRKAAADTLLSPQRLHKALKRESTILNSQTRSILSLPTELHHKVFDHLDDLQDVVSLGLANQHFSKLAPEHVHNRIAGEYGRWANEKLVCVGDDIEPGDFPPGLFSRAQLRVINKHFGFEEPESGPMMLTLQHLANSSLTRVCPTENYKVQLIREQFSASPGVTNAMLARLGLPLDIKGWDKYFPRGEPWILRNLTTKELVRAEAIATSQECVQGPVLDFMGFGEAIITRICWSSSGNGIRGAPKISRGVWAGHRFDITTLARHQEETGDGREWTDATDEVAKEVDNIWRSNFGRDWRRTRPRGLEDILVFTW